MKNKFLLILIVAAALLCGCEASQKGGGGEKFDGTVGGLIEKGPFVQGSTVTLSELNDKLEPTGKSFTTTVINDQGVFKFEKIALASPYVKLSIDGFYFNEVRGELSRSRIVLSAYAEVNSADQINVNVLTHLEMERVKSLVVNDKKSFAEAKKQAQAEVLKAFGITNEVSRPETISITANNSDAEVLIAVSSILLSDYRGYVEDAALTEMLSKFTQDVADNGVVNDQKLIDHIARSSEVLPVKRIRENIVARYSELGKEVSVPDFSEFVTGLWKPDLSQPIKLTLKLRVGAASGGPRVASRAAYTDVMEIKQADIFLFSPSDNKLVYKTRAKILTTKADIVDNTVHLELPSSILEEYVPDGSSWSQPFNCAVVVNSGNDFSTFSGTMDDLKFMSEKRTLAELNLASMADYDFTKPYAPDSGFPMFGAKDYLTVGYDADYSQEISVTTMVARVRVEFQGVGVQSVTIKGVNGTSTLGVSGGVTKAPVEPKINITQKSHPTNGNCFYIYPSSWDVTMDYVVNGETLSAPAFMLGFNAGKAYKVMIKSGGIIDTNTEMGDNEVLLPE